MTLIELPVFLFIFGGSAYAGHQIGMLVAPSHVGAWTAATPITGDATRNDLQTYDGMRTVYI